MTTIFTIDESDLLLHWFLSINCQTKLFSSVFLAKEGIGNKNRLCPADYLAPFLLQEETPCFQIF